MAPIAMVPGLSPHTSATQRRRGVLLLVVLSMLTLFLMLGASYLVVAIRARKVSKAFADKIVAPATAGPNAARVVDAAFMTVARGSTSPGINTAFTQDSLLADKYGGSALTGRITAASAWNGSEAFIQIQASRLSPAPSSISLLPGRVLTFTLPGVSISTRILRAFGNSPAAPTLVVPAGTTANGVPLSVGMVQAALGRATQGTTPHLLINGREFDDSSNNEPYDGFDSNNPLLTRMIPDAAGGSPTVSAANMYGASPTLTVDNDGDGTEDSNFVPVGLPQFTMSSGAVIQPRAAVLVVELDGRLNVNVHDSTIDADTSDPTTMQSLYPPYYSVDEIPGNGVDDDSNGGTDDQYTWTPPGGSPPPLDFSSLPRGASSGATDISLRKSNILPTLSGRGQSATSRSSTLLATTRAMGGVSNNDNLAQTPSNSDTQRPIPKIGGAEGRYGGSPSASNQPWDGTTLTPAALPRPGLAGFNDPATLERERWTVNLTTDQNLPGHQIAANFFTQPGRYGSPPDVKGRMRIWADPSTGRPVFYKPYWDENGRSGGSTTISDNEVVDDPFEINLSRTGPRINAAANPGQGGNKIDNLFTAADLEGLLRCHDPDSPRLSRRLVAINDRSAEMNRLRVTTESWDTPAVVGVRWEQSIRSAFSQLLERNDAHLFFAPETIAGHRLDINRPFHDFTRPPSEFLFDEPYFYDANANWTRDNSENTNTGELRRQQFAKHLYCLLVAIARGNNATINAPTAERIAQYAVNVVDFRDADSIMTRFSYDPAFAPGSTTWSPGATNYVWGCERPEILLTETYAWHDRRTDDETIGGSVQDAGDGSFDQIRRPRGAFFVELTCPWGSEVREYGGGTVRPLTEPANSSLPSNRLRADLLPMELVQTEDANGNGVLDSGEDVIANNKIDANPPRNRLTTSINLEKTVPNSAAANRSPVWRLVSTRKFVANPSNSAFGTDPLLPATPNPNDSILDPARPGGPRIDRIFYFTQPPSALANEIPGAVFWQQAPPANPLTPGDYRVYGTDAAFDPAGGGNAPAHVTILAGDGGKPATLTEPTIAGATDPYDSLMQAVTGPPNTPSPATGMVNTWGTAIDDPLDAYGPSTKPIPAAANITTDPFLKADGSALLMQNGTHENFAVIHLQRLADPTKPLNNVSSSSQFNPYITVDCLPVDLAVVNSVRTKSPNQPSSGLPGLTAGNYDEPGDLCKPYGHHGSSRLSSIERGGDPADAAGPSPDIWSRRIRHTIQTLQDSHAFITDAVIPIGIAPAANLPAAPLALRSAGAPKHTLDGRTTAIQVTNGGSGYDSAAAVNVSGGGGNGLTAVVSVSRGVVTEIRVTNPGSGYTSAPSITVSGGGGSGATATAFIGGPPSRLTGAGSPAFLHWANRPFTSGQELALVPIASPFHLLQLHSIDTPSLNANQQFAHLAGFWENSTPPAPWNAITGRSPANSLSFLDCVHVPSRFAGLYSAVPNAAVNTAALAALGLDNYPTDHVSTYREPGRINVNTITDQSAWRALFGSRDAIGAVTPSGPFDPDVDQNSSGADRLPRWAPNVFGPAVPVAQPAPGSDGTPTPTVAAFFLAMPGPLADGDADTVTPDRATRSGGYRDDFTGDSNRHRSTDRNALFRYQTMMQLSDRVTTRSNVFAVWVTIGYFDTTTGNEVQPITRHRGFYLFDRSIPVAYEQGQNHNVRDAILLRRIIQ